MKQIEVLGIPLLDLSTREAMKKMDGFFESGKLSTIAMISMRGLMAAQNDESIKAWMGEMDLTVPSDSAILQAGKISNRVRFREVDTNSFSKEFFKKLIRHNKSVFLLSDTEAGIQKMRDEIKSMEDSIRIVGSLTLGDIEHGDDFIVNEINARFADVLISNISTPERESFFQENHMKLNVSIWMMVRPDTSLHHKSENVFYKLYERLVTRVFHIRINRYEEQQNKENDSETENQ